MKWPALGLLLFTAVLLDSALGVVSAVVASHKATKAQVRAQSCPLYEICEHRRLHGVGLCMASASAITSSNQMQLRMDSQTCGYASHGVRVCPTQENHFAKCAVVFK